MKNLCLLFLFLVHLTTYGQEVNDAFETAFTKYRVSTKNCTKLEHYTGSLIFIPDNAFAIDPQNPVDSVDIYYREMTTPLDMIVHEIPMVTELMGKRFFLESNGMFEIWARSGSDTVNVHEDRSIEVRLAIQPNEVDVRMEGFQFDHEKNLWESYTNRIGNVSVNESDDDLWGSSPVENIFFAGNEGGETMMSAADTIRKAAFQAMEIYDFGLYNYDKIIQGENFVPVQANFITQTGQPLQTRIYVVYEDLNSVFYYLPEQWEDVFSLIKGREYKLFAISDQGNIASLNDFPNLDEIANQSHTFRLEMESQPPKNRQELAKMTGVQ